MNFPLYRRQKVEMVPYAIRIQSLPDLKAATKWLTNSNRPWQVVSNLLNKGTIPLNFHLYQHSPKLNRNGSKGR
jgi:hypothetical protein